MRAIVFAGLVLLAGSALASPATDYFKEATDLIAKHYYGTSTASIPDAIAKHKALLDAACAKDADACPIATAAAQISALAQEVDWRIIRWPPAQAASTAAPRPIFGWNTWPNAKYGEILVRSTQPNGGADKSGLLPGDRIVAVNGKTLGEQPSQAALSSAFAALVNAVPDDQAANFTVIRGELATAQKLEIPVTRNLTAEGNKPFLYTPRGAPAGVMVLKVPTLSWSPTAGYAQRLHDLVREAQKQGTTALILDLSDTTDGIYWAINAVAGAFLGDFEYTFRARDSVTPGGFKNGVATGFPAESNETVANPAVWTGKLVVLTSKLTISGSEVLAYLLQSSKRALVIGEETQGYLQVMPYIPFLSDKADFLIPAFRVFDTNGNYFAERVTPDIPVAYNREEASHTGVSPLFEQAYKTLGLK